MVHGIFHNSTAYYRLEKNLKRRGFKNIHTIEFWTSIHTVYDMRDQLIRATRELSKKGKVRIVAHSLGGMVARVALLDPEFAEMVDKVVFLGTPHQGNRFYDFSVPQCLRDLSKHSELMAKLREHPLPDGIRYWNFRGKLDVVTPARDTFLPNLSNVDFEHVGHAGLLTSTPVFHAIRAVLEIPVSI